MLGHDFDYLLDVRNMSDGETDDEFDQRLRSEAKELGVDVDGVDVDGVGVGVGVDVDVEELKAHDQNIHTLDQNTLDQNTCYPRRSESIDASIGASIHESFDSTASHSTALTSDYSHRSRDQDHFHAHRRPSRTSPSFRHYDAFVSRRVPDARHSISFSPLTTPSNSTPSLPMSQPPSPHTPSPDPLSPKKHFRRIRGLSMLKLYHRTASDPSLAHPCPHCPHHLSSQRRAAVHKLPCGHRVCTHALRNTVQSATASQTGPVPSCCGKPIPGSMVEHVMTQEEQTALLDKLEQWDEAISIAPSMTSSRRDSTPSVPHRPPGAPTSPSRTVSDDSSLGALPLQARKDMEQVMEREDYTLLRTGQAEQRDRFWRCTETQRMELREEHERLREEMKRRHETALEDTAEHHASAMSEAEDKQVKAEADMRQSQHQERRDNATALKHMEAYCAGTYSTGEPHDRTVTDQDRAELEKTRRARDQMDTKHEGQINVLRGEQGRRMRLRSQRQDRELQDLRRQQRQEELQLERACTSQVHKLDQNAILKQKKIQWRWELQMAIFAKKVEAEEAPDLLLNARLPTADWYPRHDTTATATVATRSDSKHGISTGFAVRARPRTN
ncbi:Hypothetical predicted protein [Lecanosticta acicola]|uniref:Uncharacterized protein n=1 Tax=Lecanosticta acicola TaxID=111012 RepID=A0AAI8YRK9_9PEZI|nr:Hypothetical predicted protein [Lecanosticta acicola]